MSIKEVGAEAFYYCQSLKRVELNEGLEKLGAAEYLYEELYEGEVFEKTAIENIRIPSTLRRIEQNTFG